MDVDDTDAEGDTNLEYGHDAHDEDFVPSPVDARVAKREEEEDEPDSPRIAPRSRGKGKTIVKSGRIRIDELDADLYGLRRSVSCLLSIPRAILIEVVKNRASANKVSCSQIILLYAL